VSVQIFIFCLCKSLFFKGMSNVPAIVPTTKVVGYFNGNKWPIQLVISKLSITLHLQPGEYILDRQGRKINDPFFEVYANSKQLQRETCDKPVPVIRVPVAATTVAPRSDGHSVRTVTEFKEDKRGVRQPVMPVAKELPEQPINKPSVVAMSMDEARKSGLIRKVREVPEDFGVTDTDGTPPRLSDVPKIKYAIDSSMNHRPADLPKELLQMPTEIAASRQPLLAELRKAENTNAQLDSETGFMNTVVRTAPPNAPVVAGKPAPIVEAAPGATGANVMPEISVPLPEPELEELTESLPPVPTDDVAPAPPEVSAPAPKSDNQFVCAICGVDRKFRSQLKQHAETKHPDQVEAIMAPYPASA
jgi:hypothetical protein